MSNSSNEQQAELQERFLASLRYQLAGLKLKVENDFSEDSFNHELAELKRDSVYPAFAFDTPEYVLVRLMGRMSIAIGRRLGEIYDKTPRLLAAARFKLAPEQVAPKINKLVLDVGLRFSLLNLQDANHVKQVSKQCLQQPAEGYEGLGIEIRYNFNPNDSARLRKDVDMASSLLAEGLIPVYLIFSSISPRNEAIARLERAGWRFLVGEYASNFTKELFGLDLNEVLDNPKVKQEIRKEVDEIMSSLVNSYAFRQVLP